MKHEYEVKDVLADLKEILSNQLQLCVAHFNTALCAALDSSDWVELVTYFVVSGLSTDQASSLASELFRRGYLKPDGAASFRLTRKAETLRSILRKTVALEVEVKAELCHVFETILGLLSGGEEEEAPS